MLVTPDPLWSRLTPPEGAAPSPAVPAGLVRCQVGSVQGLFSLSNTEPQPSSPGPDLASEDPRRCTGPSPGDYVPVPGALGQLHLTGTQLSSLNLVWSPHPELPEHGSHLCLPLLVGMLLCPDYASFSRYSRGSRTLHLLVSQPPHQPLLQLRGKRHSSLQPTSAAAGTPHRSRTHAADR